MSIKPAQALKNLEKAAALYVADSQNDYHSADEYKDRHHVIRGYDLNDQTISIWLDTDTFDYGEGEGEEEYVCGMNWEFFDDSHVEFIQGRYHVTEEDNLTVGNLKKLYSSLAAQVKRHNYMFGL